MKAKKKPTTIRKKLRELAWLNFRKFIIDRDTDFQGYCHCISCPKIGTADEFQAGHFDHGKDKENYYNPKNVHAQCVQCNYYGGVKTIQQYTLNMVRKYGDAETEKMKDSKRKYWKNKELENIIKNY